MRRNFNFLRSWKGRLGNNIITLGNVVHYSKMNHQRLRYKSHWIFPKREFNFGDNTTGLRAFYGTQAYHLDKDFKNFNLHRYKIFQELMYPLLLEDDSQINSPYIINIEQPSNAPEKPIEIIDKKLDGMMLGLIRPRNYPNKKIKPKKRKQLLIYVRSGDIIKDSRVSVNPMYVQSPNSYIQYVLAQERPEKIIVLYEDERNPMVPFLKENYGSIICQEQSGSKSLRELIAMLLDSEVLVQTGLTTLVSAISLCSHRLKKIYIPQYEATPEAEHKTPFTIMSDKYNPSVEVRHIEHKNYVKVGQWKGKPDQSLTF